MGGIGRGRPQLTLTCQALVFRVDCRLQYASPAKAGMILAPLARILSSKFAKDKMSNGLSPPMNSLFYLNLHALIIFVNVGFHETLMIEHRPDGLKTE